MRAEKHNLKRLMLRIFKLFVSLRLSLIANTYFDTQVFLNDLNNKIFKYSDLEVEIKLMCERFPIVKLFCFPVQIFICMSGFLIDIERC